MIYPLSDPRPTYAVLDLGTNTFHLLLVSASGVVIKRYNQMVRLVKENPNHISDDALQRAAKTLKSFAWRIKHHDISQVSAVATSAFRIAENGQEIRDQLQAYLGHPIRIISGEEEAQLIYQGNRACLPKNMTCMMDIGGGSVEFSLSHASACKQRFSLEIGAQRLYHRFYTEDPMPFSQQKALRNDLQRHLKPLKEALDIHRPKTLLGTSGTFTMLYKIYAASRRRDYTLPATLCVADCRKIYEPLLKKTRLQRLAVAGMSEARVDLIVVAAITIDVVLDLSDFEKIIISPYALKEGLIGALVDQNPSPQIPPNEC